MNHTRLEELREEKELTKRKIAADLGVSGSLYGRWENDRFLIPTRRLYQLGNYFQVNIDYILRLTVSEKGSGHVLQHINSCRI